MTMEMAAGFISCRLQFIAILSQLLPNASVPSRNRLLVTILRTLRETRTRI